MITKILSGLRTQKKSRVEEKQLLEAISYIKRNPGLSIVDLGFNVGRIYKEIRKENTVSPYYAFEIQKDLVELARKIEDPNLYIIHAAATSFDGEVKFFEPKSWSKNFKGGATIHTGKNNLNDEAITVAAVNFGAWLAQVRPRSTKYFIKVDIEGAEYELLESMVKEKQLDPVEAVAVEWHCTKLGAENEAMYTARKNLIKLALWENGIKYFEWF